MAELRARMEPGTLLTNLRVALSADCPRRHADSIYVQCEALIVSPEQNGTSGE